MQVPSFEKIPLTLFSKRSNKTTKLVNNADPEKSMQGKRMWYPLSFDEPVYISKLVILASGYRDGKNMEFEFQTPDGRTEKRTTSCKSNRFEIDFGKFVSSLQFRPDDFFGTFQERTLISIEVIGFSRKDFDSFEQAVLEVEESARVVASAKERLVVEKQELLLEKDTWATEKAGLVEQRDEISKSLASEQTKLDTLISQIESREGTGNALEQQVLDLQKLIESRSEERRDLVAEIDEKQRSLISIRDEIGLFPIEIAEFVKEGKRNIALYLVLSVPLFGILLAIAALLFKDALDLVKVWEVNPDVRVWDLFLTRLPFVIVAVTVLEVCGFGVGKILSEIFRITRQRLSLSKLSIISKDVTAAATFDEELSQEERVRFQTELKMQLLREHIKEEVGEDFQYRGTFIQETAKALISKVGPKSGG